MCEAASVFTKTVEPRRKEEINYMKIVLHLSSAADLLLEDVSLLG
jgi:hypothetical protein